MNKNLKFFLTAFFISLPFWLGINLFQKNLEDFFFSQEISKNPEIFLAKVNIETLKREESISEREEIKNFEISAKSAISVLIDSQSEEKIIFEKNSDKSLPIASLTKLMTAKIVLENYDLSQIVEISQKAVSQEEDFGNLKVGEIFAIEDLLYLLLMESSNDAAYSLAEQISPEGFLDLMNLEAKYLGMKNTKFEDSTGISEKNQSNIKDLIVLTKNLLERPLIWEILSTPEFDLYSPDGVFHHKLQNTNELMRDWKYDFEIIGGKTGYSLSAKGCFLLVLRDTQGNFIINIVLGSEDRFGEMKKLINFVEKYGR